MSAPIGAFPKRRNTIKAEVLARTLQGEELTGMDAVRNISTTRLASPVHILRSADRWPIESREITVHTSDGRTEEICEYFLRPDVREAAMAAGGAEFCDSVREARAALRGAGR